MDLEQAVGALRDALASETDVRSAWLFGSAAKGSARQDSDLDVAVWMQGECSFERLARLASKLEGATGRPVDLVVLNGANPLVARDAIRGIPLFTRDEGAEIEFVLAVDREAEDWAEFVASFLEERRRVREESRS